METSDDPVTMAALAPYATVTAAAVGIHAATGGFGGGGGGKYLAGAPGQAQRTAEPTVQLSEAAKRNRRLAASTLTKGFAEPTLGVPGLLGA